MRSKRRLVISTLWVLLFLLNGQKAFHLQPVHAQTASDPEYYDGILVYASVEVDSNYYLYTESYTEVEFDLYEDIDGIEDDVSAYEDYHDLIGDDSGSGATIAEAPELSGKVPSGHEYDVESDGYACYDDGEGDCDSEYVGSADASIEVASAAPNLTSLATSAGGSTVTVGTQGTLTVTGTHIVGTAEDNPTISYGGSGVTFTPTGTPTPTQAQFSYSVSSTAPVGTHDIMLTTQDGTSNGLPFTVGYPPAIISSLSSYTWVAGTTFPLTITGTGFGTQPTVTIAAANVTPVTTTVSSSGSSLTISAVVVAANAPNEPVAISVQPGYVGNTFICGTACTGNGSGSSGATVQAVTPAPQIMFLGQNISGQTVQVMAGQQIALSVSTPSGYIINNQGWSFANQAAISGGFVSASGSGQPTAALGGQEASDPTLSSNPIVFYWVNPGDSGEVVTYTYTLNNGQAASAKATFNIGGPNGNLLPNAFSQSNNTGTSLTNINGSAAELSMSNSPIKPGVGVFINDNAMPVSNGATCQSNPGVPPPAGCGQFVWVQILKSVTQHQIVPVGNTFTPSNSSMQLDGTYPYPFAGPPNATWDSPGRGLLQSWGEGSEPFSDTMYVLWDPALPAGCTPAWTDTTTNPFYTAHQSTCTSIPIPLGSVQWNWSACAINARAPLVGGGTMPAWFLQCGTGSGSAAGVASGYPEWASGTGPGGCSTSDHGNCQ